MSFDQCRAQYVRRLDKICSNHFRHSSASNLTPTRRVSDISLMGANPSLLSVANPSLLLVAKDRNIGLIHICRDTSYSHLISPYLPPPISLFHILAAIPVPFYASYSDTIWRVQSMAAPFKPSLAHRQILNTRLFVCARNQIVNIDILKNVNKQTASTKRSDTLKEGVRIRTTRHVYAKFNTNRAARNY